MNTNKNIYAGNANSMYNTQNMYKVLELYNGSKFPLKKEEEKSFKEILSSIQKISDNVIKELGNLNHSSQINGSRKLDAILFTECLFKIDLNSKNESIHRIKYNFYNELFKLEDLSFLNIENNDLQTIPEMLLDTNSRNNILVDDIKALSNLILNTNFTATTDQLKLFILRKELFEFIEQNSESISQDFILSLIEALKEINNYSTGSQDREEYLLDIKERIDIIVDTKEKNLSIDSFSQR